MLEVAGVLDDSQGEECSPSVFSENSELESPICESTPTLPQDNLGPCCSSL